MLAKVVLMTAAVCLNRDLCTNMVNKRLKTLKLVSVLISVECCRSMNKKRIRIWEDVVVVYLKM